MARHVFFIHGLSGNPKKTWGKFPALLQEAFGADYSIAHLDYESPSKWLFWKSGPTLFNIAEALILKIQQKCNLENDEVTLIGHSNGGIVIKKLLLRLEVKEIRHNISKICFLDVPHQGSGYAIPGKVLNPRNKHLNSLSLNSTELTEINDFWLLNDYHKKFEVLNLVAEVEDVVSASSSRFCYANSLVVPGTNHSSISKPLNSECTVVEKVTEFISKKMSLVKYNTSTSETYRDWLLHDGGRRHGHTFVADERRLVALKSVQKFLKTPGAIVRITGLSGLGKTRLITEYIEYEKELSEENILVFKANTNEGDVRESVKKAVRDAAYGLIIVEHCAKSLHDYLATEIANHESYLRVITVDFYDDQVTSSPHIHLTKLNDDSVTELVTPMLPQLDGSQIRRIVSFVEGFPLLAILIAERFRDEGVLTSQLTERDFAEKLINGHGGLTDEQKSILQVCSLFDVFGVEAEGIEHADYIIKIAKSDRRVFGQVINQFQKRRIINRVGRYARVVPKPLAVHLASMWWDDNVHDELENLVNTLPPSLIGSFCTQIKYLDSSAKVREFVSSLCEECSPFGRAELLLSKKGSRLFRALVEVNPEVTSDALSRVILSLSDEKIATIDAEVRRNLVWALEMLVFHKSCFEKSAWTLFKLAQFESESFSNNSLGQFSQLLRWQLSGTEANFEQKLAILHKALALNVESADFVIVESIKVALSSYGGTRTVGAEFQGTKPQLKEWYPKTYQEIYDYWQALLNILLILVKRGSLIEEVKESFGVQIRGLIRHKIPDILDTFFRDIIRLTGKYWPSAAESISHALHYDSAGMSEEQINLLLSWKELLSPDENNIEEQLKLIVLDPVLEHETDVDGRYIDMAAEEAKKLASDFKNRTTELYPFFELLTTFDEQKQSWTFAKHLILETDQYRDLLSAALEHLRKLNQANTQFLSGLLCGIHRKEPQVWKETLELIGSDRDLVEFYPEALRTGEFEASHLDVFIKLIVEGKLSSQTASTLMYGRATEHLSEEDVVDFCTSLGGIDAKANWVSLDIMNMYARGRNDIAFEKLKPSLLRLTLNASFDKEDKTRHTDGYHWLKNVKRLLNSEGDEFALKLCIHIMDQVCEHDVDYSDLWDYLNVAFYEAFKLHGDRIWHKLADFFIGGSAIRKYRLGGLLNSSKSFTERDESIFDTLEPETVVDWCNNEDALQIVGRSISLFVSNGEQRAVNPLMIRLLSQFSNNELFLSEISANFYSRSWTGSLIPYLESDKELLQPLSRDENINVRNWAIRFIENIEKQIRSEEKKNAEEEMLRE